MAMKGTTAWLLAMNTSGKVVYWAGVTTTPISDGSTTNPVMINGSSVTVRPGGAVGYDGNEYVLSEDGVWQEFGETDVQHKTLDTPITVDGTEETTVEGALGAINEYAEDIEEDLETGLASQIDLLKDTVGWTGKNLLNPDNYQLGMYTDIDFNRDSSLVYCSARAYVKAGTYTISFNKNINIVRTIKDGSYTQEGASNTRYYTISPITDGWIGFSWRDSTSSSTNWDITSPVQIEHGTVPTTYEPYHASVEEYCASKQDVKDIVGWGNKNICNVDNAIKATNLVSANNDGIITFRDVVTAQWSNTYIGYFDMISGKEYVITTSDLTALTYGRIGFSKNPVSMPQASTVPDITLEAGINVEHILENNRYKCSFTANETVRVYLYYCNDFSSSSHAEFSKGFMVRLASDTSDTYEPYHASVEEYIPQVVSDAVGWDVGNVLPNEIQSDSYAGVSWTVNSDGSITFNGTATAEIFNRLYFTKDWKVKAGVYYLNGGATGINFQIANKSETQQYWLKNNIANNVKMIVTDEMVNDMHVRLIIPNGTTLNNVTVKYVVTPASVDERKSDISALGPHETANASKLYHPGEHFYKDGAFCTVTGGSDVAANTPWAEGTNYSAGDVAELLTTGTGVATEPHTYISLDGNVNKARKSGKIVVCKVRFTVSSELTGLNKLFKMPYPAYDNHLVPLYNRNQPYNIISDLSTYVDISGNVYINGTLSAGQYDFCGTYFTLA